MIKKSVWVVIMIVLSTFVLSEGSYQVGTDDGKTYSPLFAISGVANSNCNSQYESCYTNTYYYEDIFAKSTIEINEPKCDFNKGSTCYLKSLPTVSYYCQGDSAYHSWQGASFECSLGGCYSGDSEFMEIPKSGSVTLQENSKIICFDDKERSGKWVYNYVSWSFNQVYSDYDCNKPTTSKPFVIGLQDPNVSPPLPPSSQSLECSDKQVCTTNYMCADVECTSDSHCGYKSVCDSDNICRDLQCLADSDCKYYELCSDTVCTTNPNPTFMIKLRIWFESLTTYFKSLLP